MNGLRFQGDLDEDISLRVAQMLCYAMAQTYWFSSIYFLYAPSLHSVPLAKYSSVMGHAHCGSSMASAAYPLV
jgi:hypothetical protein